MAPCSLVDKCRQFEKKNPLSGSNKLDIIRKLRLTKLFLNPLNAELNPICYLLALLGAHCILHISMMRVNGVKVSL